MFKYRSAFTLIELLVVVSIITVLVGVAFPVIGSVQIQGRKVQSLSNMRQLGTSLALYCAQNNGMLPQEGEQSPTWNSAATDTDANNAAWYNALPRMGNFPSVGDFATHKAAFYTKENLLYVPAATYPSTKLSAPLFAVSFCSKLYSSGTDASVVRLQNIQEPARTVIFQESGVTGETKTFATQSAYNGQSKSFASRSIARYKGKIIVVFADGHAESMDGSDVVDRSSGKGYFPQSNGKVFWTIDPDANPNL